jgi:endonuclease/exonuclease/phosphatase family metal-dependent hydrolase
MDEKIFSIYKRIRIIIIYTMIILSWNINNDYRDIIVKVAQIIDLLNTSNADVIGLQEVIPEVYDLLYKKIKNNYIISEKHSKSFFNIMISKFNYPIKTIDFVNTSMNRGFVIQKTKHITFITTHLESIPISKNVRSMQVDEIMNQIQGDVIVFGDTNFTETDELFGKLYYEMPNCSDIYTFDSDINKNAMPPFRSNLDRFYTNISNNKKVDILTDFNISDHFPILLTFI